MALSKKKIKEEETKRRLMFGYIHVPKTGGTSIARALGVNDSHHPINLRRKAEEDSRLRWAATIRNPWDHMRSWFFYHEISRQKITFEEWVLRGCSTDWTYPPTDVRILYQEDWIEVNGQCDVDYLMRFENFDEEFRLMCDWLEIKEIPKMSHFHLQKHAYQDIKKLPYWENFTPKMKDAVAHICEPFAEKYGYRFGE